MPKVLLVEDDPTMLHLLDTLLKIEGFSVVQCDGNNLEELLELARQEGPDAALLDVHLKRTSGIDILRKLRMDPHLKSVKVVMTSGLDKRSECISAGADDFLQKPYMPDQLVSLFHKCLAA
jgi:DNA-binding response OmpR family regulator